MIRLLEDMPPGTLGVEAAGTVTAEDHSTVLVPAIEAVLERGDVRLMYMLGDDFDSYTAKAVWADARLGSSQWRFETDEVAEARAWLVGIDLDDD